MPLGQFAVSGLAVSLLLGGCASLGVLLLLNDEEGATHAPLLTIPAG